MQIVIAWTTETKITPNGKTEWRDGVLREAYDLRPQGHAAMWLRDGDEGDLERAKAYAATEGYQVLTYPESEADPLGNAREYVESL